MTRTGLVNIGPKASRNARSVWTIATQPTPVAHFATYPQELAERCILAGTSERGACAECGAPWARVLERENATRTRKTGLGVDSDAGTRGRAGACEAKTTGWAPTCDCPATPSDEGLLLVKRVRPCVALDPFSGTGTTGKAAAKLGRDYIGIDLHPGHTRTAQRRLTHRVEGPLFEAEP